MEPKEWPTLFGSEETRQMAGQDVTGRPAAELSDEELERQGTQAHETRNWVFLHGSAEQFARHTSRMLELEQEYLRRHPQRTWQATGGAAVDREATAAAWRETLTGIIHQLEALIGLPDPQPDQQTAGVDPAEAFLRRMAQEGGAMHKLEAHQVARDVGLDRAALADLYRAEPPFVATAGNTRVLTDRGWERTQGAQVS
jgi:hypothetical protein